MLRGAKLTRSDMRRKLSFSPKVWYVISTEELIRFIEKERERAYLSKADLSVAALMSDSWWGHMSLGRQSKLRGFESLQRLLNVLGYKIHIVKIEEENEDNPSQE